MTRVGLCTFLSGSVGAIAACIFSKFAACYKPNLIIFLANVNTQDHFFCVLIVT
jgi:hypothetical protein